MYFVQAKSGRLIIVCISVFTFATITSVITSTKNSELVAAIAASVCSALYHLTRLLTIPIVTLLSLLFSWARCDPIPAHGGPQSKPMAIKEFSHGNKDPDFPRGILCGQQR